MSKKNYNYGHNAASSERTELEMDRVRGEPFWLLVDSLSNNC